MYKVIFVFFGIFFCNASIFAEQWISQDKVISVTVPDSVRFSISAPQPDVPILWVSEDEKMKIGVSISEIPKDVLLKEPNLKLIPSSIEEGIVKMINGKILASIAKKMNGYDVYQITAHGTLIADDVYLTQYIVKVDNMIYKAMAIGFSSDPRADSDAVKFLNSFNILKTNTSQAVGSNSTTSKGISDPDSWTNILSTKIAYYSFILLIIAFVVSRFLKKTNS